ncbi:MAG: MarR family transcriptional regulator [Gammaproteobacteria bacterium]|nr:MarR family transcriptional regulator [Gammaproteobacteria bacterium]
MELKPQELLVLLKVAAHPGVPWTYAALSHSLSLSPGEAHASVRRAIFAGLAVARDRRNWSPVRPALIEFAVHGVRYAFPAEIGAAKRGIPTAYGAEPLASLVNSPPAENPVWAHPQGAAKGPTISPIYRTAPLAAMADPHLHQLLALLDALRVGRQRERALAAKLFADRLNSRDAP